MYDNFSNISSIFSLYSTFPSAEAVLSGARHMVAFQLARDPLVKQSVRQVFYERAKIYLTPTKKGKKVQ